MAALPNRKGIANIKVPETIVLPRPMVRFGLICRRSCRGLSGVIKVGRTDVWLTRWDTVGTELPWGMDWIFYAAISSVFHKNARITELRFQGVREVQRLAEQLDIGTRGGAMTKRTADAVQRLAQARFGFRTEALEFGNSMDACDLPTEPLFIISSGLASLLWGAAAPKGITIEEDSDLWIRPTTLNAMLIRDFPFMIPKALFCHLSTSPESLSIGLVIAAYAQATTKIAHLSRNFWETLVRRVTTCPANRTKQRLGKAITDLMAACQFLMQGRGINGTPHQAALKIEWDQDLSPVQQGLKDPTSPGRPASKWGLCIFPAKGIFVR